MSIEHSFIDGNILVKITLVNAAKNSQVGAHRSPAAFATIAVNLSNPVSVVISGPFALAVFVLAVTNCRMCNIELSTNLIVSIPFVGV